jgi:3-oxoacyl-[acyl-carrier-protein] synthase III
MGVAIQQLHSFCQYSAEDEFPETKNQVLSLAERSILPIIRNGLPKNLRHLVIATSCPDALAPSVGQMLNERYHDYFSNCQTIDMVQGCAGGVAAMILGSQLSELSHASTLVVAADAARKATSKDVAIHKIFGNGSFACLLNYESTVRGLIHHKSHHYKGLSEIVTIRMGHDSDVIIMNERDSIHSDPRRQLGLSLDNSLALKLISHAEEFYLQFVEESASPNVMILHQVNPDIIRHLKAVFGKYDVEFVDLAATTGNCGAATVGIAMEKVKDRLNGKKVLLCSFGTGGVITAGLWQN